MGLKVIGLLGIVYLNVKKEYLTIEEAKFFLDDAINHGYRISKKIIEDTFTCLQ
jgi:predicted nucleic acid-binding protein